MTSLWKVMWDHPEIFCLECEFDLSEALKYWMNEKESKRLGNDLIIF